MRLLRHQDFLALRDNRVGLVLALWAVYTLVTGFLDPFTDNLAHAGGLLAGCVLDFGAIPVLLLPERERSATSPTLQASLVATLATLAYTAYFFFPALGLIAD